MLNYQSPFPVQSQTTHFQFNQHFQFNKASNQHCAAFDPGQATLADLVSEGINTFSMNSGLVTGDFGWGSQQFAKMGRSKIKLIAMFLELGVQVGSTGFLSGLVGIVAVDVGPWHLSTVLGDEALPTC